MPDSSDRGDVTDAPLVAARGSNQSGMRAHNERLVLSLVRRHTALSKSEIARLTGLSAQTVSVIMRALEADGLLVKGTPVRGRVGQPSVPMMLAAGGAYFYGLKLGRRSADLILIDFLGQVIARRRMTYRFPMPHQILDFVTDAVRGLTAALPPAARNRIAGFGVAMPFSIWNWAQTIGLEPGAMDIWRDTDIRAALADRLGMPVFLQNDATAACGAELVFGDVTPAADFLYFYIGYFIGGGIVLNGNVFSGKSGNAGALGSLPVPSDCGGRQLLDVASLHSIATMLEARGERPDRLWNGTEDWDLPDDIRDAWIDQAARGLAFACVSAISVIDFETVMIDGWMPDDLRDRLVSAIRAALHETNAAGLSLPAVTAGTVGPEARSLGAASLPLSERFLLDGTAFMKQT